MHVDQLTYVWLSLSFSLLSEGGWGEHTCCLAGNLAGSPGQPCLRLNTGSPSGTTCVSNAASLAT